MPWQPPAMARSPSPSTLEQPLRSSATRPGHAAATAARSESRTVLPAPARHSAQRNGSFVVSAGSTHAFSPKPLPPCPFSPGSARCAARDRAEVSTSPPYCAARRRCRSASAPRAQPSYLVMVGLVDNQQVEKGEGNT